jgi:hypothetical protein
VVLYITAIVMRRGAGHEHIAAVLWETSGAHSIGESPLSAIVVFIQRDGGDVRVRDRVGSDLRVGVVDGPTPHIRAFTDDGWTDHLRALPRYETQ